MKLLSIFKSISFQKWNYLANNVEQQKQTIIVVIKNDFVVFVP